MPTIICFLFVLSVSTYEGGSWSVHVPANILTVYLQKSNQEPHKHLWTATPTCLLYAVGHHRVNRIIPLDYSWPIPAKDTENTYTIQVHFNQFIMVPSWDHFRTEWYITHVKWDVKQKEIITKNTKSQVWENAQSDFLSFAFILLNTRNFSDLLNVHSLFYCKNFQNKKKTVLAWENQKNN